VRSGQWKLHLEQGELYHLGNDIGEAKNIAEQNAEEVKRLRALAETMRNDLGLDGVGPGCRPLGRFENPKPLIALDGKVRADMKGAKAEFP
jgi:arylsulfatase A